MNRPRTYSELPRELLPILPSDEEEYPKMKMPSIWERVRWRIENWWIKLNRGNHQEMIDTLNRLNATLLGLRKDILFQLDGRLFDIEDHAAYSKIYLQDIRNSLCKSPQPVKDAHLNIEERDSPNLTEEEAMESMSLENPWGEKKE